MKSLMEPINNFVSNIAIQYSVNPMILHIVFAIITVLSIYLAIKLVRKVLKIVFMVISLLGITMTLYGEQIVNWILQTLASKL